jgi:hypothetical protein
MKMNKMLLIIALLVSVHASAWQASMPTFVKTVCNNAAALFKVNSTTPKVTKAPSSSILANLKKASSWIAKKTTKRNLLLAGTVVAVTGLAVIAYKTMLQKKNTADQAIN